MRLKIADLCAGTGSATIFFEMAGHHVDRFDLPDGDITTLTFMPGDYDFIWASPPCQEYSKFHQPWYKEPLEVDLGLWEHCRRLIVEADPLFYVIENSIGAVHIWGPPDRRCGSFCFWGNLPIWPHGRYYKDPSGVKSSRARAMIPKGLARQFAEIVPGCYKSRMKLLEFFSTPPPSLPMEPVEKV